MQDFRHVLRARTRDQHDRVDDAFSAMDIQTQDGLRAFLGVHGACFQGMLGVAHSDSSARRMLSDMIARIRVDLHELGGCIEVRATGLTDGVDPLALDYVLEGSRLGSKVLKKRWGAASDPAVLRANAYFSMPSDASRWSQVCFKLGRVPVDTKQAHDITQDVIRLFTLFHDTALSVARTGQPAKETL